MFETKRRHIRLDPDVRARLYQLARQSHVNATHYLNSLLRVAMNMADRLEDDANGEQVTP